MVDLVIPYYNAGKTIQRALASISMQTIKDKIHVIIIDDHSEDKSNLYFILEDYKHLLDIEYQYLNKNIGPGGCRRTGMKLGKHKYIMFMDADDTLHNAFSVEHLVNEMEKHETLDAITSWFVEELDQPNTFFRHENDYTWVFGKMYRRSFIEENEIYFNDTRACEDSGFNAVVFTIAKFGELQEVTYCWHKNPNSITRIDNNIYTFSCMEQYFYNMEWAIGELERIGANPDTMYSLATEHFVLGYFYFLEFYFSDDNRYDLQKYKVWAKRYYDNVYSKYFMPDGLLTEKYSKIAKINQDVLLNNMPPLTLYGYIDWLAKNT